MVNNSKTHLYKSFRIFLLFLTTLVLFLGVITINNKLNRAVPDSGLLAITGSGTAHITFTSPDYADSPGQLSYYTRNELIEDGKQVIKKITGTSTLPNGTQLQIECDFYADHQSNSSPIITYEITRLESDETTLHTKEFRLERMFAGLDEDLGVGGTYSISYVPDYKNSSGPLRPATVQINRRNVPVPFFNFVEMLAGFSFLLVGFVIYFTTARRNLPFTELFLLISISFFVLLSYSFPIPESILVWITFWLHKMAYLFAPALLLHFFILNSRKEPRTQFIRRLLFIGYAAPIIFLILDIGFVFYHWFTQPTNIFGMKESLFSSSIYDYIQTIERFSFPVYIGTILMLLLHAFGTANSIERKRQIKWVFWGIGIGLFPYSLIVFPFSETVASNHILNLALSLPLFITPFNFALAVFSLRFVDVEDIFKRGLVYFTTSFSLLTVYLILIYGLTKFAGGVSPQAVIIISGGVIMLATLVSNRIKDQIQLFFEGLLYRDYYNFRTTLQKFSLELNYVHNYEQLTEKICTRIQDTFSIPTVLIYIRTLNHENFVQAHSSIESNPVTYINSEDTGILSALLLDGKPLYLEQIGGIVAQEEFSRLGAHIFIPFLSRGEAVGFLALGATSKGDLLTNDDLELLTSLADRAAVSLENALLYLDLEEKAEEFRQLKEFSENIVESIDSGICTVDNRGIIKSWNSALEYLLSINKEQAIGKHLLPLLPERLAKVVNPYVGNNASSTGKFHSLYKIRINHSDGSEHFLNLSFAPLGNNRESGKTDIEEGHVIIIDDITDGVKMEEQLVQQEKMAGLGLLAAGVAHEVNTPLTGIASYVQLLQNKVPDDPDFRRILEKIEKQSFRASKIINSLLSFSRQSASDRRSMNFNNVVEECLTLIESQLRQPGVKIQQDLEDDLQRTNGDRTKLQQVVINLLLNARDAMPKGGTITITTRNHNNNIVCSITDMGRGMTEDILPKIFDPFFTTKNIGHGTGLGLSVSYGIIHEHGGDITVKSELDKGTTFNIHLPAENK